MCRLTHRNVQPIKMCILLNNIRLFITKLGGYNGGDTHEESCCFGHSRLHIKTDPHLGSTP